MSSEMTIDGKVYVPSKEAAVLAGYTQDYIGQLARAGAIDARRIGGLWYVFLDSLKNYKKVAESYIPMPPGRPTATDVESFVSFDGKDYVSAAHAAELTGYTQDYVGQLAREGVIVGRQVGNRWYVAREAILVHKKEKDALLGAVQAQSVGIVRGKPVQEVKNEPIETDLAPHFTYTNQEKIDLTPSLTEDVVEKEEEIPRSEEEIAEEIPQPIPIRVIEAKAHHTPASLGQMPFRPLSWSKKVSEKEGGSDRKTSYSGVIVAATVILVIVSAGYFSLRSESKFASTASAPSSPEKSMLVASTGEKGPGLLVFIENFLAPEIVYKRASVE